MTKIRTHVMRRELLEAVPVNTWFDPLTLNVKMDDRQKKCRCRDLVNANCGMKTRKVLRCREYFISAVDKFNAQRVDITQHKCKTRPVVMLTEKDRLYNLALGINM